MSSFNGLYPESSGMAEQRGSSATDVESSQVSPPDFLEAGSTFKPCEPLTYQRTGSLELWQVASFIINKMIGSGIFSAPLSSYRAAGSVALVIVYWLAAFVHSLMSAAIYIDYCSVLPYTGGELVYLTEITAFMFSQAKANASGVKLWFIDLTTGVLGDGLLMFVTYSVLFILVFTSATNAMQFGRLILLMVNPSDTNSLGSQQSFHVARFIGIVAVSAICLLHHWSPRRGRLLNIVCAGLKILAVAALFIVGVVAKIKGEVLSQQCKGVAADQPIQHEHNKLQWASTILTILFSFQGWENATFVAGEISTSDPTVFRRGFYYAVISVGFLYMLVVTVLVINFPLDSLDTVSKAAQLNFPPMFTGCGPVSTSIWAGVAALSSLGSMNSIIYTFARVKQAIGHANVLPWSSIWRSERVPRPQREPTANDGKLLRGHVEKGAFPISIYSVAPSGGLLLHWMVTMAMVVAAVGFKSPSEAVSFPGLLQTYSHLAVLAVLGSLWWRLRHRENSLASGRPPVIARFSADDPDTVNWYSWLGKDSWRLSRLARASGGKMPVYLAVFLYALFNLLLLVCTPISSPEFEIWPEPSGEDEQAPKRSNIRFQLPRYGYSAILVGILAVGVLYYTAVFGTVEFKHRKRERSGWVTRYHQGRRVPSLEHDRLPRGEHPQRERPQGAPQQQVKSVWRRLNVLWWFDIRVKIERENDNASEEVQKLDRVERYGQRWRITYELFREDLGPPHTLIYLSKARGYRNHGETEKGNAPDTWKEELDGDHAKMFRVYRLLGGERWVKDDLEED